MSSTLLANRPQGQFPVSIATSLALEGLLGILEDQPVESKNAPIANYDGLAINVRTLVRNMYSSLPGNQARTLTPDAVAEAVEVEMQIIQHALEDRGRPGFQLHFYALTLKSFYERYKFANTRGVNTDFQKLYDALEADVNQYLINSSEVFSENATKPGDLNPNIGNGRMLLLTHYPLDLLNSSNKKVALLESHTGRVKTSKDFNTKLKTGNQNLPFDIMTLQFFGDTGNMFKPFPVKIRKVLLDIAEKNKWNQTTTEERIKFCVRNSGEPHLYTLITDLYKSK